MQKWLISSVKKIASDTETRELSSVSESVICAEIPGASNFIQSSRQNPANTKLKKKNYQEHFLQYGFTFIVINEEQRPHCVLCSEILANESMKPVKLKRHLNTKHSEHENKSLAFFQRKLKEMKSQVKLIEKHATVPTKALQASFEIYLIAKAKKGHTIGEKLLLPAAIKINKIMYGDKFGEGLKAIPLSNDTVSRRIESMAEDIKQQLITRIKASPHFAIQLDESTDVINLAQLLVYVRYCYELTVCEDFLFCYAIPGTTTGLDIFGVVDNFFKENDISWYNCFGVCTDGACAMTGEQRGFKGRVLQICPNIKFTHCFIHRESLAARKLQPEVNKVFQEAVLVVNFVRSRALNSRLFSLLCKEMGSDHDKLLLHSEVRWLSRGKVLQRLVELKDELRLFLLNTNPVLASHFTDETWISILSYLSDIFEKLNDLNTSLQGPNTNILQMQDKISAFIKKLDIWKNSLEKDDREMFPCLSSFMNENDVHVQEIKTIVVNHLSKLSEHFNHYFPFKDCDIIDYDWIRNPFGANIKISHLPPSIQESLTDLSNDRTLGIEFQSKSLSEFWLLVKQEYEEVSKLALKVLLPFASTYQCETAFSALINIKNKYRSRLMVEKDLRIALSDIKPRIAALCSQKQAHPSHLCRQEI